MYRIEVFISDWLPLQLRPKVPFIEDHWEQDLSNDHITWHTFLESKACRSRLLQKVKHTDKDFNKSSGKVIERFIPESSEDEDNKNSKGKERLKKLTTSEEIILFHSNHHFRKHWINQRNQTTPTKFMKSLRKWKLTFLY